MHWVNQAAGTRLTVGPIDALMHAVECLPPELVAACANSVLRQRPDLAGAWRVAVSRARIPDREALLTADGVCESGIEHLFWMRMRHLAIRRQVVIPRIGRVDFVIGDALVVEVDGREYHIDEQRFEADRERDAALSAAGYRVLRFSYRQVMFGWPSVHEAVHAAILRGDHG